MRTRFFGGILATILLLGALGAVGYSIFQSGYQRGLLQSADSVTPVVYYPGGWGFGVFGLFFGVLFLFMVFGFISRMIFGRRGWGNGRGHIGHSHWSEEGWAGSSRQHRHPMGYKFEQRHEQMHSMESEGSDAASSDDDS